MIVVYYGLVFFEYQAGYWMLVSQYILSFIFMTIDYFRLSFLMKRRHYFEFQRINKQMREYFILFSILIILLVNHYGVTVWFYKEGSISFWGKMNKGYSVILNECEQSLWHRFFYAFN
jgi:hypothetical protein